MKINQKQKGFVGAIVLLAVAVLLGVGYFAFVKNVEPIVENRVPNQTETSAPSVPTPKATGTTWITFSDTSHISFQYPSDWKVGKFEHYPNNFNLQPSDKFTTEAKSNNIFITVGGHCMNTQCLTVYNLDDMVKEVGATVVSVANAKNATGYKVILADGKNGYMFIKGDDLVTISTDMYSTYMDKIIPTLQLLTKE